MSGRSLTAKSALRCSTQVRYAVVEDSSSGRATLGAVYYFQLAEEPMADKPLLAINYHTGTIQGPSAIMSQLFATPKTKSWDWLPEATIVISDPQRLQQTVARLRQLGYPLVESPIPHAE